MRLSAVACLGVVGLAGVASAAPPPLAEYTAPPAVSSVRVSPDGKRLAYLSQTAKGRTVEVLAAAGDRRIAADALDVRRLEWLDADHLMVTNSTIYEAMPILPRQRVEQGVAYDLSTGKQAVLLRGSNGPGDLLTNSWMAFGRHAGKSVVYIRGLTGEPAFALYRVDVGTGRGVALTEGSLNAESWVVTPDGEVRARQLATHDGRASVVEVKGPGGWHALPSSGEIHVAGLTSDGGGVVVEREDGPFTASPQGSLTPLPAPSGRRLTALVFGRDSRLRAAMLDGLEPEYVFYDPGLARVWPKIVAAFRGRRVRYLDGSDDGGALALSVAGPDDAEALYWGDMRTLRVDKVADMQPGLPADAGGESVVVDLKAADGLTLPSILTTPARAPRRALPLVVIVGEQPEQTMRVGFVPYVQALASRGYAVLRVNTRGSPLALKLHDAGVGELGRGMQTDLSDAVGDLARRGVIDAKRVCIMGTGYGGFAALAGVTLQHGVYRCAVAANPEVAASDAVRWPDIYQRGGQGNVASWRRMTGADAPGARERIAALSPLAQAAHADAPVLLIADDLYPQTLQNAQRMRGALSRAGKTVEWVELTPKTGDFASPNGATVELEALVAFLQRYNPA